MTDIDLIADELLNIADNIVLEEFPTIIKGDASTLKNAANIFLSNISEIYTKIQGFNTFKKAEYKLKQLEEGKGSASPSAVVQYQKDIITYKAYRISKEEFDIFISQLDKFQTSLNAYLGKQIQTIYLYNDGKTVEIYKLVGDISEAVRQDIASRGAGISARFDSNAINNNSVFEKIDNAQKNESVTKTYKEVLERGNESRKWLTKRGMMIFWCPNAVWKKMYVAGGAGDIGEAYLSFMLDDERMSLITGSDMELDVDVFMLSGVRLVDNISGLLKGDFSVGDIEYAAKAEGASMMGYRQVIALANLISKSNVDEIVNIIQEKYDKILKKEKSGSGRRNRMKEVTNDSIDNILKDFTKKRLKNS